MTEKPELQSQPAQAPFANASILGIVSYVIFPILALVTAVFGVILVIRENLAGIGFFVVLQLWIVGGVWAHLRRGKLMRQDIGTMKDDDAAS